MANVSERDGNPQQAYETTSMLNAAATAPIVQARLRKPSVRKKKPGGDPRTRLESAQKKCCSEKRGGKRQRARRQSPAGVRDDLHVECGGDGADRAGEITEAECAKEKPSRQSEGNQADRRAPLEVQHRLLQQQAKRHVNAGRRAGLLVAEPVQVVPVAGKRAGHLDRVGADRAKRAVVREQNQRWSKLSQNRNSVTTISTPAAPANGLSQPVERSVERNGKFTVSVYCHCSLLSDEPKNRSRKKTVTQPSCQCSHGTFGRADS